MEATIFTEASTTTGPDGPEVSVEEHLQGSFLSVKTLADDLRELVDVSLFIVDPGEGVISGSTPVGEVDFAPKESWTDNQVEEVGSAIIEKARESDILFIAFSTPDFERLLLPHIEALHGVAEPGDIWCFAGARSVLDSLGLPELIEVGVNIHTYERMGVARINKETRHALVDAVREESDAAQVDVGTR